MSRKKYYFLYVFILTGITLFVSLLVINGNLHLIDYDYKIINKQYYSGNSQNNSIQNKTDECPCKNMGGDSHCKTSFRRDIENPNLRYILKPNVNQLSDGLGVCIPPFHIRTNSYGFRDFEYSKDKPKNTRRIIVLGDSFTFGHGVELNETYVKVLERHLNNKSSDKKYQVLNFGTPGYNIIEKVELFKIKASEFEPDLIIFQYLADDIIKWDEFQELENRVIKEYLNEKGNSRNELSPKKKRAIHLEILEKYLDNLRTDDLEESQKLINKHINRLDNLKENDTKVLFLTKRNPDSLYLKKIILELDWYFLRLDHLNEYPKDKLIIHPKDGHPTAFAHKIRGKEIFEKVKEIYN